MNTIQNEGIETFKFPIFYPLFLLIVATLKVLNDCQCLPLTCYSLFSYLHPTRFRHWWKTGALFNLDNCELNVFESYQQAYHVPLTFHDLVITSMVRGKKIMHLFHQPAFDYLPGKTVIVPADETMIIDFPEAGTETPTQCIALAVDVAYINQTISFLNQHYNENDEPSDWKLQFNQYHFANDNEVTDLINKIIRICSSTDSMKNVFADLNLKELLIRLLQSQHLQQVAVDKDDNNNKSRLHFVLHYIHEHLTEKIGVDALSRKAYLSRNIFFKWFKEQFGITPLDYINKERVKMAKQLLSQIECEYPCC